VEKKFWSGMQFVETYLRAHREDYNPAVLGYLASLEHIGHTSPQIVEAILSELKDQRQCLKMIASENYSSLAVQLSMGNLLTDKYSEGFPRKRFYAGCENVDLVEEEAVAQLKKLFGCDHAYVQPHSGADANLIAFWAILVHRIQDKEIEELGLKNVDALSKEQYESLRQKLVNQKVMGLSLNSGGHLTHGYRHNVSSKMMQSVTYDIDPETETIDYKALEIQVQKEKPLILIAGYSSYPKKINFAKMRAIADTVGATLLVDMAHFAGLVAGGVFQGEYNPVPYAHIVTSTTHKTLRGPRGGMILCTEEFAPVVNKGCPLVIGGPLPHVMAAKAIAFKEANEPGFKTYAHQIVKNAKALAEGLKSRGVKLFGNGTENHLIVANIATSFGLTGRQAELALREAMITVNRNAVPFDPEGPWYTSGIRLGTPALTTRGMKENEMEVIAECIVDLLKGARPSKNEKGEFSRAKVDFDDKIVESVQERVAVLTEEFPLYPELEIALPRTLNRI